MDREEVKPKIWLFALIFFAIFFSIAIFYDYPTPDQISAEREDAGTGEEVKEVAKEEKKAEEKKEEKQAETTESTPNGFEVKQLRSIEHYAIRGSDGVSVAPKAAQKKVVAMSNALDANLRSKNTFDRTIHIDEAIEILEMGGIRALLELEYDQTVEFVHHPGVAMSFSVTNFIILMKTYEWRGENFVNEHIIQLVDPQGKQVLDKGQDPALVFSLMQSDFNTIYENTDKWPDGRSFVREYHLTLVVWSRSLLACMQKGSGLSWFGKKIRWINEKLGRIDAIERKCIPEIKKDVAARPKSVSGGHGAAVDLAGWTDPEIYCEMLRLGYVGGYASSLYPGDDWHFSFTTEPVSEDQIASRHAKHGITCSMPEHPWLEEIQAEKKRIRESRKSKPGQAVRTPQQSEPKPIKEVKPKKKEEKRSKKKDGWKCKVLRAQLKALNRKPGSERVKDCGEGIFKCKIITVQKARSITKKRLKQNGC